MRKKKVNDRRPSDEMRTVAGHMGLRADPVEGQGVYFVEAVGTGLVKIGYTTDLRKRLCGLQTGSASPLRPLAFIHGATVEDEVGLHRRFREKHARGEWFTLDDDIRRAMIGHWVNPTRQEYESGKTPPPPQFDVWVEMPRPLHERNQRLMGDLKKRLAAGGILV